MAKDKDLTGEHSAMPPLNAIRCYAAVVREGGVTAAATALGITQSAASRHVMVLERYLGVSLVARRGRRAEPTDVGRAFVQSVGEALDVIDFTARRIRQPTGATQRLTIRTSLPSFAYGVLIPRLAMFEAVVPGISLDLVTSLSPPNPDDAFDVLITRDLRLKEDHTHWHILEEHAVLAVPPGRNGRQMSLAEAIKAFPLLSASSRPDLVPRWAGALDIPLRELRSGSSFGHTFMALQAVTAGQGALVVPDVIVALGLSSGAFDIVAESRAATGMDYLAYEGRAPEHHDAATAFCRQLTRLCRDLRKELDEIGAASRSIIPG